MNMQALIDGMSAQWQRERSESQMTLGKMIAALAALPPDALIEGMERPHSYRGYYCDLAFEPSEVRRRAGDVLAECRAAMGKVFEGYKGGDFVMGELTPLWLSVYGTTGRKIISLRPDGTLETADDE